MTEPAPSPLSTTDPDSLTILFDSDPLELSEKQIMSGILELRRRRNAHLSEEAAKALAPKRTRAKADPQSAASAAKLDKPITEVSLDDLD